MWRPKYVKDVLYYGGEIEEPTFSGNNIIFTIYCYTAYVICYTYNMLKTIYYLSFQMQCFPLFSLILALGNPVIDYLSLDIEGAELEVRA